MGAFANGYRRNRPLFANDCTTIGVITVKKKQQTMESLEKSFFGGFCMDVIERSNSEYIHIPGVAIAIRLIITALMPW